MAKEFQAKWPLNVTLLAAFGCRPVLMLSQYLVYQERTSHGDCAYGGMPSVFA